MHVRSHNEIGEYNPIRFFSNYISARMFVRSFVCLARFFFFGVMFAMFGFGL